MPVMTLRQPWPASSFPNPGIKERQGKEAMTGQIMRQGTRTRGFTHLRKASWARERIPARKVRARRRIPVRTVRARRGIPVRMVQTKEAVPAGKAEKSPGEARFIWRMKRCTW